MEQYVEFVDGDKITVKDGVVDPDFGTSIEGWTGEISEVGSDSESRITYRIEWDEKTIKSMSKVHIATCEKGNLDHACMYLFGNEIELQSETPMKKKESFLRLLNKWLCRVDGGKGENS